MRFPRLEIFFVIFPIALGLLGYVAWGYVGLLLAFWVGLFWFSIVHKPRRHELTLISGLGLIGAFAFLPYEVLMKPHLVSITLFVEVAVSPVVYAFFRPKILATSDRKRQRRI